MKYIRKQKFLLLAVMMSTILLILVIILNHLDYPFKDDPMYILKDDDRYILYHCTKFPCGGWGDRLMGKNVVFFSYSW